MHGAHQVARLVVAGDERAGAQDDAVSGDLRGEAHDRQVGDEGGDPVHLLAVDRGLSNGAGGQLGPAATDLQGRGAGVLALAQGVGDRVEQQQVGVDHLLGVGCR